MWRTVGKPKTCRVTKSLAEEFRDMDSATVDRPLSERRLQVYRKMVKEGGFRPVTWAKVFCKATGQEYRVNGQHTSTIFAELNLSQHELYATIESYECDDLEDVAKLYATFDSKTMTRTSGEINHSFAALIPELAGVESKIINLLVAGLGFAHTPTTHGSDRGFASQADRAELLFDNVDVCQWIIRILKDGKKDDRTKLMRMPVIAAMIGSFRKCQKDAEEFWTLVRDETGATVDTPDRKLAKFLNQHFVQGGAKANVPHRFRVLPKEFYVKSIHAWNAWRRDTTTQLKYQSDAKIPSFA